MKEEVVVMYRPCGEKELNLVVESGFKEWPKRLPDQPIFYPVTNEKYAVEISQWNVKHYGKGFVTKFSVKKSFVEKFEIKIVGKSHHTEWWIPADQLTELNKNIVGYIEIIKEEDNA